MSASRTLCTTVLFALAASALAVGCGSDDGSALEAIYEVDTWTRNDTSCDTEGSDILSTQSNTTFYIRWENFLGTKFLNLKFCDSVADCETLAGDDSTINIGRYGFDQGSDGDGWSSGYYAGFASGDTCDGDYIEATLTGDDTSVRVEIRATPAGGFAPDADGFCDDEAGRQAAQGQPCGSLEVFAASRVADLP